MQLALSRRRAFPSIYSMYACCIALSQMFKIRRGLSSRAYPQSVLIDRCSLMREEDGEERLYLRQICDAFRVMSAQK